MTTFTILQTSRVDGRGVLQTLENIPAIPLGDTIDVTSTRGLAGTGQTVVSLVDYELTSVTDEGELVFDYNVARPNQLIFINAGSDIAYGEDTGTVSWEPQASWIESSDVEVFLGISAATANDTAYIASCTNAANVFAYRRRTEAGYSDDRTTVPDAAVKLGTTLYAASLYRERGSVDSFASFDGLGQQATPFGSLGRIMQLLGINRPQVG
mgnify:CR=1 FL=1